MNNLTHNDKIIYHKVYEEIKTHSIYNPNYFTTFEEFLIFCEENNFSSSNSLLNLMLEPKNHHRQIM